jgi:heme oxygenase
MRTLKAATAAQHARLERRVDITSRLGSRSAYRELLERLYGFYRPLEAVLEPFELPVTPKLPLLVADIVEMDGVVVGLPIAGRIPAVRSLREALGVLYVLEGATLGGAVIARMARRELGVSASFFGVYGSDVARHWRAFGAVVERHGASTHAAVACFDDLEAWLLVRQVS